MLRLTFGTCFASRRTRIRNPTCLPISACMRAPSKSAAWLRRAPTDRLLPHPFFRAERKKPRAVTKKVTVLLPR
ncbi:unnamed protein product [Amoebophrya sp. A120]|nr:unnamed protein product [Amoebophrya sp. A120]|eukprot:GSA120T00001629001.1